MGGSRASCGSSVAMLSASRQLFSARAMRWSRQRRTWRMAAIATRRASARARAPSATAIANAISSSEGETRAKARGATGVEVALLLVGQLESEAPSGCELQARAERPGGDVARHQAHGDDVLHLAPARRV